MFPSKVSALSGGATNSLYSLNFDGTNDYVQSGNITVGTSFSISLWFNANAVATNRTLLASSHYHTSGKNGNFVLRITNSTNIAFASYDGTGAEAYEEFTVSTLNTGVWYHLVITCNGTTLLLYLNGTVDNESLSHDKDLSDLADGGLVIGDDLSNTNNPFFGKIDEVSLFTKALSSSEVLTLFDGRSPELAGDARIISALAGYWKYEEGVGTSAYDSSTNNNTATLTNMDNADWAGY